MRGFTLNEILIVVGIFVIIVGGVIIAIDPAKRFTDSRNSERKQEVTAIVNALNQWSLDTGTYLPAGVSATQKCIGTDSGCYSLSFLSPAYLDQIPEDPKSTAGQSDTGYSIIRDPSAATITISAPLAESGEVIQVMRK